MKPIFIGSLIGGAIGAIVIMVGLTILNQFVPLKTVDMLSFTLVVAGLIITALTVLGGFTIINTWNDIDARTRTIVEKYQRDAEKEIERNSTERQKAIEDTAERTTAFINKASNDFSRHNKFFIRSVSILTIAFFSLQFIQWLLKKRNKSLIQ